jgi:hypothetical protein
MQRSVSGTWRAPCLDAPSQLLLLAGREHGRTIPLADIGYGCSTGPVPLNICASCNECLASYAMLECSNQYDCKRRYASPDAGKGRG